MDTKSASQTRILGLTLEQYAGIQAALLHGFPLEPVLKNERLSPTRWARARAAWGDKLARDGHAGPLAAAFRSKSAEAASWLGRRIAPLEEDLQAWFTFLGAYAAEDAPAELLGRLGLRDTDVQRLVFTWKTKTDGDPELAKKAAEIAASKPRGVPNIRVTEGKLRPFPWSPGPEAERVAGAIPSAPDATAALRASDSGAGPRALEVPSFLKVPPVLSPGALSPGALSPGAVPVPIVEPHRPAPAPVPRAGIGETVATFTLPLPASAALPFDAGAPPAPPASPAPPSHTGGGPGTEGGLSTGTALAFELPKGPDLPFPSAAPARIEDPSRGKELASIARAIAARPAKPASPPPAAAPVTPAAPATPAAPPPLTLEQHASLCAELAFRPDDRASILSRYRVTEDATQALRGQYHDRPDRKAAWETAYRTYLEWLTSQARGR